MRNLLLIGILLGVCDCITLKKKAYHARRAQNIYVPLPPPPPLKDPDKGGKKSTSAPTISSPPTTAPSASPSAHPTISHEPTMKPSSHPTKAPTLSPSATPSSSPTELPSVNPTISAAPTSNKISTTLLSNGDALSSTCVEPIPGTGVSSVKFQLVNFTYQVYLTSGSKDPLTSIRALEKQLHSLSLDNYLDCDFNVTKNFYVYSVSSLPLDTINDGESCTNVPTNESAFDCYVVQGGLTLEIFYTSRRRLQQTATLITDPNVVNSLGGFLKQAFDNVTILENTDLQGADFIGLDNVGGTTPPNQDYQPGASTGSTQASGPAQSTVVVSALAVSVAALIFVFVVIVAARRRRERRKSLSPRALDDDWYDDQSRSTARSPYEYPSKPKVFVLSDLEMKSTDSRVPYSPDEERSYFAPPKFIPSEDVLNRSRRDLQHPQYEHGDRHYLAEDTVVL